MAVGEEPRALPHEPAAAPGTAVLHEWATTVDHKKIGVLYVLMAVVFLIIAGCEAVLMRLQLLAARASV